MSSTFPGSSAKIPTSAYSLSLTLAVNVGFHDTGPDAVSLCPLSLSGILRSALLVQVELRLLPLTVLILSLSFIESLCASPHSPFCRTQSPSDECLHPRFTGPPVLYPLNESTLRLLPVPFYAMLSSHPRQSTPSPSAVLTRTSLIRELSRLLLPKFLSYDLLPRSESPWCPSRSSVILPWCEGIGASPYAPSLPRPPSTGLTVLQSQFLTMIPPFYPSPPRQILIHRTDRRRHAHVHQMPLLHPRQPRLRDGALARLPAGRRGPRR